MSLTKTFSVIILCMMVAFSSTSFAQVEEKPEQSDIRLEPAKDVTDQELERFARAVKEIVVVQNTANAKIQEKVTAAGLDMPTFQRVQQAQYTDKEAFAKTDKTILDKYNKISADIVQINAEVNTKIQDVMKNSGLEAERFQQIGLALQEDQAIQERYRKYSSN